MSDDHSKHRVPTRFEVLEQIERVEIINPRIAQPIRRYVESVGATADIGALLVQTTEALTLASVAQQASAAESRLLGESLREISDTMREIADKQCRGSQFLDLLATPRSMAAIGSTIVLLTAIVMGVGVKGWGVELMTDSAPVASEAKK